LQADDGIRDFHVTGVQTCALPISPAPALLAPVREHVALQLACVVGHHDVNAGKPIVVGLRVVAVRPHAAPPSGNADALHGPGPRSEERRVGKESSSRSTWCNTSNR